MKKWPKADTDIRVKVKKGCCMIVIGGTGFSTLLLAGKSKLYSKENNLVIFHSTVFQYDRIRALISCEVVLTTLPQTFNKKNVFSLKFL